MKLLKYLLFMLLFVYLTGCIAKHATYHNSDLNGKKPAILFVNNHFASVSIDGGKSIPRPFFGGLHKGWHIYLSPGEHTIEFTYGGALSGGYWYYKNGFKYNLNAKENMYYELTFVGKKGGFFKFEEMEMPNKL